MSNTEFSFEKEWPPAARRVANALRLRRVPAPMIEDVVQETGLRIFKTWDRVDPERGLWPLALTVALNILKDHVRVEARRQETQPPRPAVFEPDPEVVALARLRLDRVREALPLLTEAQRDALLAEVGECETNGTSSSALKMLRMRARKRLRDLTGETGLFGFISLPVQRLFRSDPTTTMAAQLSAVAPLAAGILIVTIGGGPGATAFASEPKAAPRVTHAAPMNRPLHLAPRPDDLGSSYPSSVHLDAGAAGTPATSSTDERGTTESSRARRNHSAKPHLGRQGPVRTEPLPAPPDVPTVTVTDPTGSDGAAGVEMKGSVLGHTYEAKVEAKPGQGGGINNVSLPGRPATKVKVRLDDIVIEPNP